MFALTSVVRKEERALAWGAFGLLFLLMVSHAMLETARDALFLSSIPASRLPVVYLLVVVGALAGLQVQRLCRRRMPEQYSLTVYLLIGGATTLGLWRALPELGRPGLYVLYVWSAVLITMVLTQFWLTLGGALTVQQAKRLYAFVGTGSVAGAIVGFALAGFFVRFMGAMGLIPTAGGLLLGTAFLPLWLNRKGAEPREEPSAETSQDGAKLLLRPYARGVAALVLVGTVTVTVADFVFKSSVALYVPAVDLASWFAGIYLVLNLAALLAQLVLTSNIVRWLGVTRSSMVLPVSLSLGAVGTMLGLGLPAALALKAADGTFRHSLNHTVRELLFIPLPARIRSRVKGIVDVVGQRGGQALASLGILGLMAFGLEGQMLGELVLALCALWVVIGYMLRKPYLAVFRRTLAQLATGRALDFPELDIASLESVIESLNSPDESRVLAAMEVLQTQGKTKLVPPLLLYHPSTQVVCQALATFGDDGRTDFIPIADKLQGNANPTVHAAVVRAKTAVAPDVGYLNEMLVSHCRATRTTAAVCLHALGTTTESEASASLAELRAHHNGAVAEIAIAEAAPHADTPLVRQLLIELIESSEDRVALEAVAAMGRLGGDEFLEPLVRALSNRTLRVAAVHELPKLGESALPFFVSALAGDYPPSVKRELPRVLAGFPPLEAVPVLLKTLAKSEGAVNYRLIRILERLMEATPSLVDSPVGWGPASAGRGLLMQEIERTLGRVCHYVDTRLVLAQGVAERVERATTAHAFQLRLLVDKQHHAEERLLRLLGLMHPTEDFGGIWRGLVGSDPGVRSSSQELVQNLLTGELRNPLSVVFGDSTDAEKLAACAAYYAPAPRDYEALLSLLLTSESVSIAALAAAQVGELRLGHFRLQLEELELSPGMLSDVVDRSLRLLLPSRAPEAAS